MTNDDIFNSFTNSIAASEIESVLDSAAPALSDEEKEKLQTVANYLRGE